MSLQYETIIGLEVHAQLATRTKLFCGDTALFGQEANTQISTISLGYPGTLPRMNKEAIRLAVRLGLATNCSIVQQNYFARKHYFYPDLPKGYQISQHTAPICRNGFVMIGSGDETKKIRINRIHMEEDAGKSMHDEQSGMSLIDFNRAGMALVEIVSEPDLRSANEAAEFVRVLRQLLRHIKVCDGNMEEGSLRCDVNISVRKKGEEKLGTKVEIKNLNSFRFIKRAIEFESARITGHLQKQLPLIQETRGFDELNGITYSIRIKEEEEDYRYFPEPDLPPFIISDDLIDRIKKEMPPLKEELKIRLQTDFSLNEYDSNYLSEDLDLYELFSKTAQHTDRYKALANWTIGPVRKLLLEGADISQLTPNKLAELVDLVEKGMINQATAIQKILPELLIQDLNIAAYIEENKLQKNTTASLLDEWIQLTLVKFADKVQAYKKGKKGLMGLFVGDVMKRSGGKADASLIAQKIEEHLNKA